MSDNKDDNKDVGGDMRANTLLLSGLLAIVDSQHRSHRQ